MDKLENEACTKSIRMGGIFSVIDNGWGYVAVEAGLGGYMAIRRAVFRDGRKLSKQEIWDAAA